MVVILTNASCITWDLQLAPKNLGLIVCKWNLGSKQVRSLVFRVSEDKKEEERYSSGALICNDCLSTHHSTTMTVRLMATYTGQEEIIRAGPHLWEARVVSPLQLHQVSVTGFECCAPDSTLFNNPYGLVIFHSTMIFRTHIYHYSRTNCSMNPT